MNPIYRVAPLTIALLLLGAAGCDSGQALCDRACDCTGCSENELESCYNQEEDAELDAEQAGCSAEYADLVGCAHDNFECNDGVVSYGNSCAGETVELFECAGETN